jgi:hypothetical protein
MFAIREILIDLQKLQSIIASIRCSIALLFGHGLYALFLSFFGLGAPKSVL